MVENLVEHEKNKLSQIKPDNQDTEEISVFRPLTLRLHLNYGLIRRFMELSLIETQKRGKEIGKELMTQKEFFEALIQAYEEKNADLLYIIEEPDIKNRHIMLLPL